MVLYYDKTDDMQVLEYYVVHQCQKCKSRNIMLSLFPYENKHLVALC